LRTIGVGREPAALCCNPAQNRVYVAGFADSSVAVVCDSGSGTAGPTVMRRLPAGAVAFDVVGRRVAGARPGVYFILGQEARGEKRVARKVVVPR
jgi:hypothetical protein